MPDSLEIELHLLRVVINALRLQIEQLIAALERLTERIGL